MKKNIAIFLSLLFLTIQSAKAEMALGVTIAAHSVDASGTETTRTSNEKNTGGNTEDVMVAEFFFEAIADNGVALGLAYIPTRDMGSKSRSDSNSEGDTGTYKAAAELDDVVQLYVDVPVYEYGPAGIYVKAGLQHATVSTLESLNSWSAYPDKSILGYTLGLVAKGDLTGNTFYKFDVTYTDFEDISISSDANNVIDAEIEDIAAKLSIGYKF